MITLIQHPTQSNLDMLYSPAKGERLAVTNTEITILLEKAKRITMSAGEREEQRRSFAYGNANIENEAVTKEVIAEVANRMVREPKIDDLISE